MRLLLRYAKVSLRETGPCSVEELPHNVLYTSTCFCFRCSMEYMQRCLVRKLIGRAPSVERLHEIPVSIGVLSGSSLAGRRPLNGCRADYKVWNFGDYHQPGSTARWLNNVQGGLEAVVLL